MPGGWLIAVMIEDPPAGPPTRHYFAVGHEDQGKAEWTAVDWALQQGSVAPSPVGGQEPVQAIRRLTLQKMVMLGLRPGEVRALGCKLPRPWLT